MSKQNENQSNNEMEAVQLFTDRSNSLDKFMPAFIAVQSNLKAPIKDTANPFFKSKYADLSSVWESARELLAANGLGIVQTTRLLESCTVLHTKMVHTSGQYITSDYPLNPIKNDPQGLGSALTYARRYSLQSMLGITPEDDDGNAASLKEAPVAAANMNQAKAAPAKEGFWKAGTAAPKTVKPEEKKVEAAPKPKFTPPVATSVPAADAGWDK